jgi:hypothetical protein
MRQAQAAVREQRFDALRREVLAVWG